LKAGNPEWKSELIIEHFLAHQVHTKRIKIKEQRKALEKIEVISERASVVM
jgi:hypothetical protein